MKNKKLSLVAILKEIRDTANFPVKAAANMRPVVDTALSRLMDLDNPKTQQLRKRVDAGRPEQMQQQDPRTGQPMMAHYQGGVLHNANGPAIEGANHQEYYLYGMRIPDEANYRTALQVLNTTPDPKEPMAQDEPTMIAQEPGDQTRVPQRQRMQFEPTQLHGVATGPRPKNLAGDNRGTVVTKKPQRA